MKPFEVLDWPFHCPDPSPNEKLWKELKVNGKPCEFDELDQLATEEQAKITQATCAYICQPYKRPLYKTLERFLRLTYYQQPPSPANDGHKTFASSMAVCLVVSSVAPQLQGSRFKPWLGFFFLPLLCLCGFSPGHLVFSHASKARMLGKMGFLNWSKCGCWSVGSLAMDRQPVQSEPLSTQRAMGTRSSRPGIERNDHREGRDLDVLAI